MWSGPSCRWSRSARSRPPRYCRRHQSPWRSGCGRHWQDRRGVAPGPCAARQRAAEQRRTVIDLDRAVGFRRAGQRQRIVIGDAVADDAAVGRERGDRGYGRGCRVDGHVQRARGHPGIAGGIGCGGGQAVGAIGRTAVV